MLGSHRLRHNVAGIHDEVSAVAVVAGVARKEDDGGADLVDSTKARPRRLAAIVLTLVGVGAGGRGAVSATSKRDTTSCSQFVLVERRGNDAGRDCHTLDATSTIVL